jgi:hypothetical protein
MWESVLILSAVRQLYLRYQITEEGVQHAWEIRELFIIFVGEYLTSRYWSLLQKHTNRAATQGYPRTLWYRKVQYRVHMSPPLVSILSHINPINTNPTYFSNIHFNIIHSHLCLPSGVFPSDFPTNVLYAFLFSHSYYVPCPSQRPCTNSTSYEAPHYAVSVSNSERITLYGRLWY